MSPMCRVFALGGLCLSLPGCREFGAGPCYHEFRDPLFALRNARDSVNGRAIARVGVTDITIGGRSVDLAYLVHSPPTSRVTLRSDTLWCDVPCGFGNEEGLWTLTVSSAGYRAQAMRIEARYRNFDGGCPSSNDGSVILAVRLAPNAG